MRESQAPTSSHFVPQATPQDLEAELATMAGMAGCSAADAAALAGDGVSGPDELAVGKSEAAASDNDRAAESFLM